MNQIQKTITLILLSLSICTIGFGQAVGSKKKNVNTKPYPLGNPVVKHMYTADASPHVMPDGKVWMVTSVDSDNGGGYETMHSYHTFSSSDMVNWTDHGEVFHVDDIMPEEVENEKWALWAPDMVYRNGQYYLYYPVRILHTDTVRANGGRVTSSYIGVAVSDSPDEKFKVLNPKIEGTKGIDPAIFIDDDGTPYLYWGRHMGAVLKENMQEFATKPVSIELGTDRFMEAPWMNKRNGEYHFSYHTKYDWKVKLTKDNHNDPNRKKSELAYSVSQSPLGPFEYKGTLNHELGVNVNNGPRHPDGDFVSWKLTQSNHGGIVEYHGQEYLFYHTSALSSWRQDEFKGEGTWTQRSVCVDSLNYDTNGNVIPVQQTIECVDPVKVNQPFAIALNTKEAVLEKGVKRVGQKIMVKGEKGMIRFKNVNLGSGYYYFGLQVKGTENAKAEIRLDKPDGKLVGTVVINQHALEENDKVENTLRAAAGKHDIYLIFTNEEKGNMTISDMQFFAGAPAQLNSSSIR
ncbi:family 43 glycosylhydrolase [Limibacter armeniacum]|uniref:family 43 glycosylhydrolase n=1 Tax=Limibacter armeniacum TaxID=466084 RepID=UPI002FE69F5E